MPKWTDRQKKVIRSASTILLEFDAADFSENPSASNFSDLQRAALVHQVVCRDDSLEASGLDPAKWSGEDLGDLGRRLQSEYLASVKG